MVRLRYAAFGIKFTISEKLNFEENGHFSHLYTQENNDTFYHVGSRWYL